MEKKFQEQQVFLFRFYILCENFSKIGPIIKKIPKFSDDPFKGTDPFFLPILIIIIIFSFLGEKVSSGIWETCPKILGGYVYQNPPKWRLIYIYI